MFDATRFLVAGVLIALVGGTAFFAFATRRGDETAPFVAASATASAASEGTAEPTASPVAIAPDPELDVVPSVDTTLLDGVELMTQAVEPGVVRIASDGVRSRFVRGTGNPWEIAGHRITAGLDGSIWVFGPDLFYRVGDTERHRYWSFDGSQIDPSAVDFAIAPDGTIWAAGVDIQGDTPRAVDRSTLHSYDGKRWRVRRQVRPLQVVEGDAPSAQTFTSVHASRDGTIWAVATNPDEPRTTLHRLDEDGWQRFRVQRREASTFASSVTVEGKAYAIPARDRTHGFEARTAAPDGQGGFWLGGSWDYPDVSTLADGVSTDGEFLIDGLLHFDGQDWQRWDLDILDTGSWAPAVFESVVDGQPVVRDWEGDGYRWFVEGRWQPVDGGDERPFPGGTLIELPMQASADGRLWWTAADARDRGAIGANEAEGCGGIAVFDGVSTQHYLRDLCITSFDVALDGSVWLLAGQRPEVAPREETRNGTNYTDMRLEAYVIRPAELTAALP